MKIQRLRGPCARVAWEPPSQASGVSVSASVVTSAIAWLGFSQGPF